MSNNSYAQSNKGAENSNFILNFDNGFKQTSVAIKDSSGKKLLFKGALTSDRILGFAKSIVLKKYSKY